MIHSFDLLIIISMMIAISLIQMMLDYLKDNILKRKTVNFC